MKECPKCHAEAADTAKFCMKCGFNFKKYEEESAEIFCPECGTKFKGGDFCPECGTNVKAATSDAGFGTSFAAPAPTPTENAFGDDNWLAGLADVTAGAVADKKKAESDAARAKELAAFTYETHSDGKVTVTGLADKHALSLNLPACVVGIADGAFEGSSVMRVTLPEGLMRIGARAFAKCCELTDINFPQSLMSIGEEAFLDCAVLDVEEPYHVMRVAYGAFQGTAPYIRHQEKMRRKAEEEERRRIEEEERRRLEEEKRRKEAEEAEKARLAAEAEQKEKARKAAEAKRKAEAARKAREEAARRAEEERQAELRRQEEARKAEIRRQEEARRAAEQRARDEEIARQRREALGIKDYTCTPVKIERPQYTYTPLKIERPTFEYGKKKK